MQIEAEPPSGPREPEETAPGETIDSEAGSLLLASDSGRHRNETSVAKYVERILSNFPTPSERYYDIRFLSSAGRRSYFGQVGDQCIMFHSNRNCLVTLAPSHPVIKFDKTIDRIEHQFVGYDKIDRLSSQPEGKSKKNCQKLNKNAPVCGIVCSDGTRYVITAGIGAKLIEINQAICSNPNLVKKKPMSEGFIAILQPNDWKWLAKFRDSLPKLGSEEAESLSKETNVNPDKEESHTEQVAVQPSTATDLQS